MSKKFELAKEIYAENGVDVESVLKRLAKVALSIHAWQGDDVVGFENSNHALTGGCQVTGNYPGRANNADELRMDLDLTLKLIPGKKKVNLQAHQVDKMFDNVDRDEYSIDNFSTWLSWAKEQKIGLDIAPAFYSHKMLDHGMSLSHPDEKVRKFWINHGLACRKIAETFGRELGETSVVNFWMPDGSKDLVVDKFAPRQRMAESLDLCFANKIDAKFEKDAVESKLFGIGTESFTVTSNEFCLSYAMSRDKMVCLDMGHFHPTENIGDKLSSILWQMDELMLHVSRGVRWDSDHVLVLNDELLSVTRETAAYNLENRIHFALDYFDASINRVMAWVIGARNFQKALLIGMLEPINKLKTLENSFAYGARLAAIEDAKTLPWGIVWDYYCEINNVPKDFVSIINSYEKDVQLKRR